MSTNDDTALPRPRDQDIAHIVEEYVADAVIISGPDSRILFWNRAAALMFGYERAEVIGHDMHDFLTPERHRERAKSGLEAYIKTGEGPFIGEVVRVTATRKSGEEYPVELAISAIEVEGQRCAIAVVRDVSRRADLEAELHRLATTDPLTDLMNRRQFFERANQEIVRSFRTQGETSVFMMDLDRFKQLNDEHGHMAGDEALRRFADVVRGELRATDIIARMGGEEFAAVLPDTELHAAGEVAERLRDRVAAGKVNLPDGSGSVAMTVSIGVVQHTRGQESFEETLRRADAALYRAKSGGRNRIWVDPQI